MKIRLSFSQRLLLCLLSAIIVWFSFPNFLNKNLTPPTAFLGWVALIPFFVALHETTPRQGALLGWVYGFSQFGGILYWIAFLEAAHYLSGPAWAVLVFYLSLYFLAFGWGYRWLTGKTGNEQWTAPCLWVALEYVRGSRPWGGFSWGELGYSQAPYPVVLTFTTWAGVNGLTFLMVCFNVWVAQWVIKILVQREKEPTNSPIYTWIGLGVPLAVLAVVFAVGEIELKATVLQKTGTVALLQPSIDQEVKWSKQNETATYDNLQGLVREASKTKPDLVIWPETAAPSYLLWSRTDLDRVISIVRESGTYNLVGCLDAQKMKDRTLHYFNAAVQFRPDGKPDGVYHKRHLVPFGEFVPFQKYLTFLGPVVGDLGNFDFGSQYVKLQTKKFSYTPMICYEVIFPGDVERAFRTGADALVNISNDAWYGRTASPYQHAMMAVVRAAEERKPLLRAANTGICLATDPFGRILCSSRLFENTWLPADVFLTSSGSGTLYARWGNWLPRLCWLIVAMMILVAIFKKMSGSPSKTQETDDHAA